MEQMTKERLTARLTDLSEQWMVAKTLTENAVGPTERYEAKEAEAYRQLDINLELYTALGFIARKEVIQ